MLIEDLHFSYQRKEPVVRAVTAKLPAGQMCALIGPNAAGKSTLMKLMLGQLEPARGSVTIDGRPVSRMKPHERAGRIAYVPQRASANVAFTVAEVVAMGRFALPADDGAVEHALEACELQDLRHRVFSHLSAGQQQRVAFARAIAQAWPLEEMRGRVMLLDEPVNAMDLWHVHHTMRLLAGLAAQGLAVLIVVHDLNLAAAYADTVWLMEGGALRAAGPWDRVLLPEILEPVYRMKLRMQQAGGEERPMFFVETPRTLV